MRNPLQRGRWRRSLTVAVTLVLTLAGGVVVAGNASAAPPARKLIKAGLKNCPYGYMCLWEHINYRGRGVAFRNNEPDFGTLPRQYRFIENAASSAFNNDAPEPFEDYWDLFIEPNYYDPWELNLELSFRLVLASEPHADLRIRGVSGTGGPIPSHCSRQPDGWVACNFNDVLSSLEVGG